MTNAHVDLSSLQVTLDDLTSRVTALEAKESGVGPAGPQGPVGPMGPVGPAGADGKDGNVTADAIVQSLIDAIAKGVTVTGSTGGVATGGTANSGATNYFPASPAQAPFPSPENSIITVINGKPDGCPYLRDKDGNIWQFATDADGNAVPLKSIYGSGYVIEVNGISADTNQQDDVTRVIIRQGTAYMTCRGGIVGVFENTASPNSGIWPVALPPAGTPTTSTGGGNGSTSVSTTDPTPASPAPGSSGKVIQAVPGGLETALSTAAAGDTVQGAAGTYNESVGVAGVEVDGGGKVTNPGDKTASYTAGAILDATGVTAYREGQGGMVLLGDSIIKGWEVTGFGAAATAHDGTGGIRNNRAGVFRVEDCYLHHNQMGIGPNQGNLSLMRLKNVLLLNNGLPQDPGYAHNIYSYATHLIIEGGVTSIVQPGAGNGHAGKFGNAVFEMYGKNYFSAVETSCIDIPHGTAKPFIIQGDATGGTTIEKPVGDDNLVLLGYGAEDQANGNAGGTISDATFIVPNDGREYIILTSGPITLTNCKFLYSDGTPMKPGTITVQGGGAVTGLP